MNIAFIGYGQVGGALAVRLAALGHQVVLAAKDVASTSVRNVQARDASIAVAAPAAAVDDADVVFLATPFAAYADALSPLAQALKGKILVDCTNPVGPGLKHGLNSEQSGTERIQQLLPQTRVVKAFTIYGFRGFQLSRLQRQTRYAVLRQRRTGQGDGRCIDRTTRLASARRRRRKPSLASGAYDLALDSPRARARAFGESGLGGVDALKHYCFSMYTKSDCSEQTMLIRLTPTREIKIKRSITKTRKHEERPAGCSFLGSPSCPRVLVVNLFWLRFLDRC
jgi:predicted dinucleotide-binding enzyme